MDDVMAIATEGLVVAYDETPVVKALDMRIPSGRITSIIGPNGCGKSTILKAIGRILKPRNGTVYLSGKDILMLPTKEVAQRMAILPQSPLVPNGLTVSGLVAYGRFPYQKGFGRLTAEDRKVVRWALDATGLEEFAHREVDTLSGGQRQRVWIAMALAQQAGLVLLDEPTTYLDLAHQLEILELLYEMNRHQGSTIAMVLHDLNLASRFSDYMIAIHDGDVAKHGTPEEVMVSEVLHDVFGIDAEIVRCPRSGKPVCLAYDLLDGRFPTQRSATMP